MMTANPTTAPMITVTPRPARGSRMRMATSAPPTAPKKQAAHARNGVSSQPNARSINLSQRMSYARRTPIPEKTVAAAMPGRNATPNVGSFQTAPGKWIRIAATAKSTVNITALIIKVTTLG